MSAISELREHLRDAVRRDIEADRTRARRVRRRGTAFLAAVLLGGAAAAAAADLISVGEPVRDTREELDQYRAAKGGGQRAVVVAESGRELPFGVAIYTAKNGKRCVIAGEVRGSALGLRRGGSFRPYGETQIGTCGSERVLFHDAMDIGDRTLLFGRAAPGATHATFQGEAHPVGDGGAFLFVMDRVPPTYTFDVE